MNTTTTTMTTYIHDENWFYRLMRSKTFWLVFWALSFSYPIYRSINRVLPPPLPIYFSVPEFTLTNEFQKPFGSKDLKGRFYIANFMFTSCQTTCLELMQKLDRIQNRLRGVGQKAAIVTFSVDPEHDTTDVLYKFARKRNANPYIWSFLTGTTAQLEKIVIEGFKVPMGKKEISSKMVDGRPINMFDIAHSNQVVLVDSEGRVRGFYPTDEASINKLMIDFGLLINNSFSK